MNGQRTRINAADRLHAGILQSFRETLTSAPIARHISSSFDNQTRSVNGIAFHVLRINADIADVRAGKRHELARVGGIREDFLITRHRGVEDNFANRKTCRTGTFTLKDRAVGQYERRLRSSFRNKCHDGYPSVLCSVS